MDSFIGMRSRVSSDTLEMKVLMRSNMKFMDEEK